MRTPALLLALAALAACGPTEPEGGAAPERAPAVVLKTGEGPVALSELVGRPVVVQFAPSDDAGAWAALADALADLEASGAVVLAVETDGDAASAEAFGYDGTPLAVVLDGEGTVRGRAVPTSGDALFALAGPVLAEADLAATVAWPGADSLDALVEAGGLVVDVGPEPGAFPYALRLPLASLAPDALPADLGTPIAFVGPDAERGAERAAAWGYVSVFVADAAGALAPVAPAEPVFQSPRGSMGGVRG